MVDEKTKEVQKRNFVGWLSPKGVLIECSYMEHRIVAEEILEKEYGVDIDHFFKMQEDDLLLKAGWIKLFGGGIITNGGVVMKKVPTKKQHKWMVKNGEEMSIVQLNDWSFWTDHVKLLKRMEEK